MRSSIYDEYIKSGIMEHCEVFFNKYLKEEGVTGEGLCDEERKIVGTQVDYILSMMTEIHLEHKDNYDEITDEIIDKLISMCVVAKMNEARLCRLLNEAADKLKDD